MAAIALVYLPYRFMLFGGFGGYLETRQGLTLSTPLAYFLSILFPYPNLSPAWRPGIMLIIPPIVLAGLAAFLMTAPHRRLRLPGSRHLVIPALVFAFGLATTAPHVGMKIADILGHSESRFALISISALAFMIGVLLPGLMRSLRTQRIALASLALWGIVSLWRVDVQLAAWQSSSEVARGIVETTIREVPDPKPGSAFYYFDIPSFNKQFAYIFGIGLREAVMRHYPERGDIAIVRQTTKEDLGRARPGVDYVFWFHNERGLERLYPQTMQE
jgi:hypothetical protein